MDDRLEKYIKQHRAEFDDKVPRKDLWKDIKQQVVEGDRHLSLSRSLIYWRAAAVLLFFIISLLVVDKFIDRPEKETIVVNEQLQEAENYYIDLISKKKEEVIRLSKSLELGSDFAHEINKLDSMYLVLKDNLKIGNKENVADAMILNLQLRIEILNQQLGIIQSIENSKNEKVEEDETIRL